MGESARQITERIKDQSGRDHTSHVLKHSIEKSYKNVNTTLFRIIDNQRKRKMSKRYGSKT